jgi:phosphodiesterase/alkaline phosphatase D-like protein
MVCWRKAPESDVARYFVFRSERPDTPLSQLQPIAEVKPGGFYLEHYMDRGLTPGTTYYYRVVAEDWASHRQPSSLVATGTTPKISP